MVGVEESVGVAAERVDAQTWQGHDEEVAVLLLDPDLHQTLS